MGRQSAKSVLASAVLLSYLGRLQQSAEDKSQQDNQFEAQEAQQQLKADTLATQRALVTAQRELDTLKGAVPFSSIDVINKQVEIENIEDGLERLALLEAELFPA